MRCARDGRRKSSTVLGSATPAIKSQRDAGDLGHARGVALLVCTRAGLGAFEYAPARVKRTVTGAGRADKSQVAQMVRVVLGLPDVPRADAADALAAAIGRLRDDTALRETLAAQAGARARAHTWERAARELRAVLSEAAA